MQYEPHIQRRLAAIKLRGPQTADDMSLLYDIANRPPSSSIAIGPNTMAHKGEIVIGGDEYDKIVIGGRVWWSKQGGHAWTQEIQMLKRIIQVQQTHIETLMKAVRQDFEAEDLGLPADLEAYLNDTSQ